MSAMTAMSAIHPVSLSHTADSILPTLPSTAFLRPLKTNNLAISPTMARELLISSSYRTRTDGPVRGGESKQRPGLDHGRGLKILARQASHHRDSGRTSIIRGGSMKRLLLVSLTGFVVGMLLTGCGGNGKPPVQVTGTPVMLQTGDAVNDQIA